LSVIHAIGPRFSKRIVLKPGDGGEGRMLCDTCAILAMTARAV